MIFLQKHLKQKCEAAQVGSPFLRCRWAVGRCRGVNRWTPHRTLASLRFLLVIFCGNVEWWTFENIFKAPNRSKQIQFSWGRSRVNISKHPHWDRDHFLEGVQDLFSMIWGWKQEGSRKFRGVFPSDVPWHFGRQELHVGLQPIHWFQWFFRSHGVTPWWFLRATSPYDLWIFNAQIFAVANPGLASAQGGRTCWSELAATTPKS